MTSEVKESHWIHRVTRQIIRAAESPGPDYDKLPDPWDPRRQKENREAARTPTAEENRRAARPYDPLRYGLED